MCMSACVYFKSGAAPIKWMGDSFVSQSIRTEAIWHIQSEKQLNIVIDHNFQVFV